MRAKRLDAVVVTERQAELVFAALMHCRSVLGAEPGDEETEEELTKAARLFVWSD